MNVNRLDFPLWKEVINHFSYKEAMIIRTVCSQFKLIIEKIFFSVFLKSLKGFSFSKLRGEDSREFYFDDRTKIITKIKNKSDSIFFVEIAYKVLLKADGNDPAVYFSEPFLEYNTKILAPKSSINITSNENPFCDFLCGRIAKLYDAKKHHYDFYPSPNSLKSLIRMQNIDEKSLSICKINEEVIGRQICIKDTGA